MSTMEELLQAALAAPDDRKKQALDILRGQTSPAPARPAVEPYLKMKELSQLLNLSVCTLWRYCVPGHELGGRRRFKMSEVTAYLESDAFKAKVEELKEERRDQYQQQMGGKSANKN